LRETEGDLVIAHDRFSGNGRPAAADAVRIEDATFAEHWDALQDEATKPQSPQQIADLCRPVSRLTLSHDPIA